VTPIQYAMVCFAALWFSPSIASSLIATSQGQPGVRQANANAARADGVMSDPALSKRWLRAEIERGKPLLVIGRDEDDKLLVGFQARSGKRLLYRAASIVNGLVVAEVIHLNSDTGLVERLFEQTTDIDPQTGKRMHDFNVNGTNLLAHLKAKRGKRQGLEAATANVATFLDREAGEAFLVGTSALYAVLEESNESEKRAALRKQFAVWAMLLQLSGEKYKGLPDPQRFLAGAKLQRLASPCETENCELRGQTFVIRKSGFFDILSKTRSVNAVVGQAKMQSSTATSTLSRSLMKASDVSEVTLSMKSVQDCQNDKRDLPGFGKCGTGNGFIDADIPECKAHDWCDCRFGAAACLVSTPDECATDPEPCASLLQAAIAVATHMFGEVFGALASVIEFVASLLNGTATAVLVGGMEIFLGVVNNVSDAISWLFDVLFDDEADPCEGMYSVHCP
jgi:hypothetical protein